MNTVYKGIIVLAVGVSILWLAYWGGIGIKYKSISQCEKYQIVPTEILKQTDTNVKAFQEGVNKMVKDLQGLGDKAVNEVLTKHGVKAN